MIILHSDYETQLEACPVYLHVLYKATVLKYLVLIATVQLLLRTIFETFL